MTVFRPADSKEVAAAYAFALKHNGPVAIVLTRQDLPLLEKSGPAALKGAYIVADSDKKVPDVLLIATGSEVEVAIKSKALLKEKA
jgi:transketolase